MVDVLKKYNDKFDKVVDKVKKKGKKKAKVLKTSPTKVKNVVNKFL